ncbi:MAG: AIR synthase-related protein, partial [Verrucomicrobiota bacterium]|nr:AIR synthase-related protein [Verrucomicrobiota bacterium]
RAKMIDGSRIRPGDVVLGLASNGLHTNGYSLARKVLLGKMRLKLDAKVEGLRHSLGAELLRTHVNYQPPLAKVKITSINGLAHITGGGLVDNLPRVLPNDCDALIETKSWRVPPIFRVIETNGKIPRDEMYQVFNMGIGMVVIVGEKNAEQIARTLGAKRIGRIESGSGITRLLF